MPQDQILKELMLRQPPDTTGLPSGVKNIPWKDEDALTRFMGGVTGADGEGGGIAGLLGTVVGMGNPFSKAGVVREAAPAASRLARLPQVEDAFQTSGKYTPEISSEMGRLIGEMIKDKQVKAGWQEFHKINPEATGHIRELTIESPAKGKGLIERYKDFKTGDAGIQRGMWNVPEAEREWAGQININPYAKHHVLNPSSKANTIGHELQHQAQQMIEGRGQLLKNYGTMEKRMGYKNNPYEWEANKVGDMIEQAVKLNKLSGR